MKRWSLWYIFTFLGEHTNEQGSKGRLSNRLKSPGCNISGMVGTRIVVFTKAVRAKRYHSQIAPHDFNFRHKAGDRHERLMGTQVLLDILMLAKCDHFLHADSSVAALASYFNPYMKSYFMEPGKFDKEQESVCKRSSFYDTWKMEQEDPVWHNQQEEDDGGNMVELLSCFLKNSAASACPNAARGLFVNLEKARGFLNGH